ncbi:MAG: hypothetical protein VKJ24_08385 [Synechococcales bacterium]|nr:hypothetical protein [Synechococcales bacterium]
MMNSKKNPNKKNLSNAKSDPGIPKVIDVDAGTLLLIIALAIAIPLFLTGIFAS